VVLSAPLADAVAARLDSRIADDRLLLFSERHVRAFRGAGVHEARAPLATYSVGTEVAVDGRVVTFPDRPAVMFRTAETAERIADVIRRGRAAVE